MPPDKHVSAKTSGPSGEHLKYSPVESALSDHRAENNKANTDRTSLEKQAHAFTACEAHKRCQIRIRINLSSALQRA
jgi:hypothetical protein